MKLDAHAIVEARIHPAIGIARVGNAKQMGNEKDYFIGPELPYPADAQNVSYRDAAGRLKRQAVRFRIYGYDKDGKVVGELRDDVANIDWQVHVANKKASWYNFDAPLDLPEAASVRSPRRNAQVDGTARARLSIDAGKQTVGKVNQSARLIGRRSLWGEVYLGEIRYVENGRLLFLGGRGKSEPISEEYTLTTFANNAGWHDDTCDGPVSAKVKIGTRSIKVVSAWVVTAPPNYATELVATQPLYDVIRDALHPMLAPVAKPSFEQHILPIFRQLQDAQWVNAGFAVQFGWHGLVDFTRQDFLEQLATVPQQNGAVDPFKELRFKVFTAFRNPSFASFDPVGWPPLYGDAFDSFDNPVSPRVGFAITQQSYGYLQSWMLGNFTAGTGPAFYQSIDKVPVQQQPDTLDRAALHYCVGGPFHPGVELTWPMRRFSMYWAPFRLRQRDPRISEPDYGDFMTRDIAMADGGPLSASGPGDLTKWMAVPWQTDTAGCRGGYGTDFPQNDVFLPTFWPARVPNQVLSESSFNTVIDPKEPIEARRAAFAHRDPWPAPLDLNAPILAQVTRMIDHFHELGILVRRKLSPEQRSAGGHGDDFPAVMYVQQAPAKRQRRVPAGPPSNADMPNLMKDIMEIRLGPKGRRR